MYGMSDEKSEVGSPIEASGITSPEQLLTLMLQRHSLNANATYNRRETLIAACYQRQWVQLKPSNRIRASTPENRAQSRDVRRETTSSSQMHHTQAEPTSPVPINLCSHSIGLHHITRRCGYSAEDHRTSGHCSTHGLAHSDACLSIEGFSE